MANKLKLSKSETRQKKLLQLVADRNIDSLKNLAGALGVSEMTVRRDIELLSGQDRLTMMRGFVVNNEQNNPPVRREELTIENKRKHMAAEKERIGKFAASMLSENDSIMIDIGTTTEQLAKHLPFNLKLTVLCNSLGILNDVHQRPNCSIICSGGYYHPHTQMFQSSEGISLIARTGLTKAFISAGGVTHNMNLTCLDQYEIESKNAGMHSAVEKILMVDSSKFDLVLPVIFSNLSEFDAIITDTGLSSEWAERIRALNIALHTV